MEEARAGSLTSDLDWSDRGNSALWRYALTIVLAFAGWFILPLPFVVLAAPLLQGTLWMDKFILLFPFLVGLLGIFGLVKVLLGRPW
ncbi:MAG: hypothetical protein ACO25F_02235 [Erythrobacter sp.]